MKVFAVFAISLVAIVAQASELPVTKPEKVGLSKNSSNGIEHGLKHLKMY